MKTQRCPVCGLFVGLHPDQDWRDAQGRMFFDAPIPAHRLPRSHEPHVRPGYAVITGAIVEENCPGSGVWAWSVTVTTEEGEPTR